ncbi:MAG: MlaD family protein [Spirochaetota bacterium]|nr:MlaD family protein [Spirochaetota bacterium]
MKKNEIAVGLFFFIALAILGYYTIIMNGGIFRSHEYYNMSVIFTDVEGLGKSDKVKVNGVLSGSVEAIQLREGGVWVLLKMFNSFKLYENYNIKIKNETALVGKYVGIYPGIEYDNGKRYAIVESMENLQGESVGDIFGIVTNFITENRANISKTVKNLEEITRKINTGKGTLGKLVNENQVHENTDGLISEIRESIEDLREQAPITSFIRAALTAF